MSQGKKRVLTVQNMKCGGCEQSITESLHNIQGVSEVSADHSTGTVAVTYDLTSTTFKTIEKVLQSIGFPVQYSFLGKLKAGLIKFTEQNIHDNLTADPHDCCSDPHEKTVK